MNQSSEPLPSDTHTQKKPKAGRRWLRWSMRTFFVAVTLVCIGFGLIGRQLYIGMVHADVGRQLTLPPVDSSIPYGLPSEESVFIGWTIPQEPVGRIDLAQTNTLPTWMKQTNSDVFFRRLDRVHITADISDHELEFAFEQIHRLGELRELVIGRQLPSSELDRLLSPLRIQKLVLQSDPDLEDPYPFLEEIGVEELVIQWAPLVATYNLPHSLKRLDVTGCEIDDESLSRFVWLENLEELDLSYTQVTQEGVEELQQQMPECKIIWKPLIDYSGRGRRVPSNRRSRSSF
ncbi:hypothetical protein C5Y96_07140 [Blastopirellula marina]|uniref:Leucine Rich repeats (2 copies) n=1 Tax=Blastopirellula marina TaxID=124 RepID=A0A2S8FXZ4_9BACT|nr:MULTISPECIES: hypothetical protein [Pirellulaceae]PQO36930.1 hypothetical protein C5Y96_07140 [Blastopirellula marina]RCS53645.1 hypothetical protein DTL36_07150 [Bremerella cremea]